MSKINTDINTLTDPIESFKIECEIELGGILFATLKASFVGSELMGAHVDLDGNVLGDTGLVEARHEGDRYRACLGIRQCAATAVLKAHRECGMVYSKADSVRTLELVAQQLPSPGLIEYLKEQGEEV